jgi:ubiquitin C-terminal hydrolase
LQDLNRIKDKPLTGPVDSDGRPDAEVAKEAWRYYKQRNDSIIVDLFYGQYRSSLVCPVCEKVSFTYGANEKKIISFVSKI